MASSEEFNSREISLTAAIDFGTTFSAYAYAFANQPDKVIINSGWGEEISNPSFKAPTCVLIDKNKQFLSFGYKAEIDYGNYYSAGKGSDFQLFRHFKMELYNNQDLTRNSKVSSVTGFEFPAVDLFAMALNYLKEHMLENIEKQVKSKPDARQIQWVLTIPAIWSDKSKQFMREVALKAELISSRNSKQLLFALEPEAASVFLKSLETNQFHGAIENIKSNLFEGNCKYMIIDAGGGTVDITAHAVQSNGMLVELISATGGPWGGTMVDKKFAALLNKVLGRSFCEHVINEHKEDCFNLMNDFEKRKRSVTTSTDSVISIPLSYSFVRSFESFTGKSIEEVIKKQSSAHSITYHSGNLIIKNKKVKELFHEVLENIVKHVRQQLKNKQLRNLNYIFLVGGFAKSKLLFQRLKEVFSSDSCTVLVPQEAVLSVIKGAVMFGYNPQLITARRMRKTYGQGMRCPFQAGVHDVRKKYIDEEGNERCKEIFKVFAAKDELIPINSSKNYTLRPNKIDGYDLEIYCTDKVNVMYTDEPGVTRVGELSFDIEVIQGKTRYERNIETRVYFGHTEIQIEVQDLDVENSAVHRTSIDFLQE